MSSDVMTGELPVDDGSLIEGEDPFAKVYDADERVASFVAALDSAGSYDAKRELWLQAIDDSRFECDLRTLFGTIRDAAKTCTRTIPAHPSSDDRQSVGASVPDQALAVPVEPVARLDPPGFDPSRYSASQMVPDTFAGLLGEIARIANDYDLRERIEEHEGFEGSVIFDSFMWRDCIEVAHAIALEEQTPGTPRSSDDGEVERLLTRLRALEHLYPEHPTKPYRDRFGHWSIADVVADARAAIAAQVMK